jgi:hypothetical protein
MLFTGSCHIAEAIINGKSTSAEPILPQPSNEGYTHLRELTKIFLEACKFIDETVKDKISHKLTATEYKEAEALQAAKDSILQGHLLLLNYALQHECSFNFSDYFGS